MKKILVPTDFSEPAANALNLAAQIAKETDAKIYLLHIIEPIKSYVAATDGMYIDASVEQKYIDYLRDNAKEQIKKVIQDNNYEDLGIEQLIALGTIFSTVNEHVDRYNIDLLIMGTQGISGLDELLIGSNTEKVVRTAHCPVLTVKNKIDLDELNKIVFATNFKKDHLIVVKHLKEFAQMFEAELTLLYVNVPNDFYTERQILKKMEEFMVEANIDDFKFHIYSELNEENGMIHYAEDQDIDLIAVATHQRSGLAHLISGSIAEDVVNHATRPVLTFGLKYLKKRKA